MLEKIWIACKGKRITCIEFEGDDPDNLKGVKITLEDNTVLRFSYDEHYERSWFVAELAQPPGQQQMAFRLTDDQT